MSDDTSTIDVKKEENKSSGDEDILKKLPNFLGTVLALTLLIFGYFSISGMILYICKVAQANIMPTDAGCFPYTDNKSNVKQINTNIFTTFTDPPLSMKLSFPFNESNQKNKLLDILRNYKNNAGSNFLANYFINIIETLIQFNFGTINFVMNGLNGLPEILIVLFGPILLGITMAFLMIIDNLYLIYLWFANMSWFFKKNTNTSGSGGPKWESVSVVEIFNFSSAIALCILFFIFFFILIAAVPVLPMLVIAFCLVTCISYKGAMNGKSVSAFNILKDLFKYYKVTIMSVFSTFVVISAFANMGTWPGVISLVVLGMICGGFISADYFKAINPDHLSALVSDDQATRSCTRPQSLKNKVKGSFLNFFNIFSPKEQNGGNLLREIKRIGRQN